MAFNQRLAGKIEPNDPSWQSATPRERTDFYEEAGRLAVKEKREELAQAIGVDGRTMKPRKHPRRDGANGPVMTPHDASSRTSRLLAARTWAGGVTLFWHAGLRTKQRTPWGTILGYHADGKVRGAPIRDVRLSRRGILAVRKAMEKWWEDRVRSRPLPAEPKRGFFGRLKDAAKGVVSKVKGAFQRPKPPSSGNPIADRYPSLKPYLRGPDGKPLA